jgi:hypothetical protein
MKNYSERKHLMYKLAIKAIMLVRDNSTETVEAAEAVTLAIIRGWHDAFNITFTDNTLHINEKSNRYISSEEEPKSTD